MIGADADLVTEPDLRRVGVLERLLEAGARLVEHPAMIVAAQAALLDDAVAEIGAAVRAVPLQQSVVSGKILVQHQVLAKQPHRLGWRVVQFGDSGNGLPIAAQQRAHRRARADLSQPPVAFLAQHQASFTSFCMQRMSSVGAIGVPRLRIAVRETSPT